MKKLLLCLIVLSVISQMAAQVSFNKAYHTASQVADKDVVYLNGSYYYTVNNRDRQVAAGRAFLYKQKASGALTFTSAIYQNQVLKVNSLFQTDDNKLMVIAQDYECNMGYFFNDNTYTYLIKMDTSGNEVFRTSVKRTYGTVMGGDVMVFLLDAFKCGFQNSNSEYVVFSDSVMCTFSSSGVFVSGKNLGFDSITAVLPLANNNILVSARIGTTRRIFEITSTGNINSSFAVPVAMKKFSFYNNGSNVIALGYDGNFYKISQTLNLISATNFSTGRVETFLCDNDSLYTVIQGLSPGNYVYSIKDTVMSTLLYSPVPTKSMTPVGLCKSGNTVGMIASSYADKENHLGRNSFSSLSVFDKNTGPDYLKDLSLVSAETDTAYYSTSVGGGGISYYILNLKIKCKIKNVGTVAVSNFKITSGTDMYNGCAGISYFQQAFSGLNLQPGDSTTVNVSFTRYASDYFPGVPQKHCVFVSVPNGEVDRNPDNNEKCVIEGFGGLSVNKINAKALTLDVFPNPFGNTITLVCDQVIKSVEVFNTLGVLVSRQVIGTNKAALDNLDLPGGIYFLNVETEKGSITRKIIKQ